MKKLIISMACVAAIWAAVPAGGASCGGRLTADEIGAIGLPEAGMIAKASERGGRDAKDYHCGSCLNAPGVPPANGKDFTCGRKVKNPKHHEQRDGGVRHR